MSKQTEKLFKDFNKFIEENDNDELKDEKDLKNMLDIFMSQYQPAMADALSENNAKTSDDFLELAETASTKKDALKYVKKAVELDRGNLDALAMEAELTAATNEKLAEKYKKLIEAADKSLDGQGYFNDEYVGEFWLITETRPYMRLLNSYASLLTECGQLRLAETVYKNMLRLCINDNLGVRYRLMHIYAYFEDEQSAAELYKDYPEDDSTQFLLPMSILYYKLGNLREAAKYLKMLCEVNDDTYKFFKYVTTGDTEKIAVNMNPYGYRPYTIEEFIVESEENHFLFIGSSSYFVWAQQKLKEIKRKAKK